MWVLDTNVYIRAFRDLEFGRELQEFHRAQLPRLVLSAVVASELLIGAESPDRQRAFRQGLLEPFRTRRRFHTPTWSTWERATAIDRRIRQQPTSRSRLQQRSFFHDILIAASAREIGATVVTLDQSDHALIGEHSDVRYVGVWPTVA